MTHLLRLLVFVCFLLLGGGVAFSRGERRRIFVHAWIACIVVVSLAVAIAQRDAWPFTNYPYIYLSYDENSVYERMEIRASDGTREWRVDPYAWHPMSSNTMTAWFAKEFQNLAPAERRTALAFLLRKAEEARRRLARGEPIGPQQYLGPLAAPDWWLERRSLEVPQRPLTRLRVYRVRFRPAEARMRWRIDEDLVAEYALQ